MGVNLSVQVLRGGQSIAQHSFDSDSTRTIKIGRLTTAQIKLEDPKVSRIHAVIEFAGVDASLIDMGSTQGTAVNGTKVNKVKLNHGDEVVVGDTTLVLGFGAPAAMPVTPTAPVAAPAPVASGATMGKRPVAFSAGGAPAFAAAGAVAGGGVAPMQPATTDMAREPNFDPSLLDSSAAPVRRITQERLRSAAVESRPHPALAPEDPLTSDNRVLELRFYWGEVLLGMYHYVRPAKVTIGESTRTNIFLSSEGLPREEFPLIRYRDGEYVLSYTSQMEGEVESDGRVQSLRDAITSLAQRDSDMDDSYNIKMQQDTRALLHWGGATFALRFVAPPKIVKPPFGKNIDLQYVNSIILSLFLHIAIIVTLTVYPHDTDSLKVNLFDEPDRFASLILEAPKENKSAEEILKKMKEQVKEKQEQIKPAEEKKEKPRPNDLKTAPKIVQPTHQKTAEEKKAEVAKKFSKLLGGGGGNLLGGGGGGSLSGTLQNVIGTAGSGTASAGLAGLGIRGSGPITGGGIGTSRGIAGIGTTGRLGGGGLGYGAGVGGLGAARSHNDLSFETPNIEGALAPEVIKKVIYENRNQVRYCYEVELQRNQNLEGRVQMKWIIGATGAVVQVAVKDSTLKNAKVEACIMSKIKNWKFPPPAGGGTVEVNYPFVFKAS